MNNKPISTSSKPRDPQWTTNPFQLQQQSKYTQRDREPRCTWSKPWLRLGSLAAWWFIYAGISCFLVLFVGVYFFDFWVWVSDSISFCFEFCSWVFGALEVWERREGEEEDERKIGKEWLLFFWLKKKEKNSSSDCIFWFLGLGFRFDQFLFWILFLGFWGFGSLRKERGRRRGREEDRERVNFVFLVEE